MSDGIWGPALLMGRALSPQISDRIYLQRTAVVWVWQVLQLKKLDPKVPKVH